MKKSFILLFSLSIFSCCLANNNSQTNSLLDNIIRQIQKDIKNVSGQYALSIMKIEGATSLGVRDELIEGKIFNSISELGKFKLITRKHLEQLLDEQKLIQAGIIDYGNKELFIGKLKGVDAFLYGNIERIKNEIIFSIQLIDVKTGAIIWAKEFSARSWRRFRFGISLAPKMKGELSTNNEGYMYEDVRPGKVDEKFYIIKIYYNTKYFSIGFENFRHRHASESSLYHDNDGASLNIDFQYPLNNMMYPYIGGGLGGIFEAPDLTRLSIYYLGLRFIPTELVYLELEGRAHNFKASDPERNIEGDYKSFSIFVGAGIRF